VSDDRRVIGSNLVFHEGNFDATVRIRMGGRDLMSANAEAGVHLASFTGEYYPQKSSHLRDLR